jgi:AcrR family transcriptional regulator
MHDRATVPRGRHAPPLRVRLSVQRRRLLEAAAAEFARSGYAEASAEAISRAAGMSKATFYEHFANKEECILALFELAATEVLQAMADGTAAGGKDPLQRMRGGLRAFLDILAQHPSESQTLLVEIIGAGPRAAQRRDEVFGRLSARWGQQSPPNTRARPRAGTVARLASPDDAYAIVGAVAELASRQVRLGVPADVRELEPVIERLITGLVAPRAGV